MKIFFSVLLIEIRLSVSLSFPETALRAAGYLQVYIFMDSYCFHGGKMVVSLTAI